MNSNKVVLNVGRGFPAEEGFLAFNKQSGKEAAHCWAKPNLHNNAFTLIELLVVVLIIGILATVAVPQYQIAVQKARFAKLRTMASSIVKAVRVYYLAHGDWPTAFSELDIEPSLTPTTNNCVQNEEMYCCLIYPRPGAFGQVVCGNSNYTFAFSYRYANVDGTKRTAFRCFEKLSENLCKTLPGARSVNSSDQVFTPIGWQDTKSYTID